MHKHAVAQPVEQPHREIQVASGPVNCANERLLFSDEFLVFGDRGFNIAQQQIIAAELVQFGNQKLIQKRSLRRVGLRFEPPAKALDIFPRYEVAYGSSLGCPRACNNKREYKLVELH